jgi:hypothetical protein
VTRSLYDNVRRSGADASLIDEVLAESQSLLKWELNREEPPVKERSFEMGLRGRKYVEENLTPTKYAEKLKDALKGAV